MGKNGIVILCALFPLFAAPARAAEKMNVILLDICSARPDHMGAYGDKRGLTPNIDSFAKTSTVFENALAEGSWCLPGYASLFTGHVPEIHGLYTNRPAQTLPSFETTLAKKLKGAGYKTALFSGGLYLRPEWGLTGDFDSYTNTFSTATPYRVPTPFESNFDAVVDWVKQNKGGPFFLFATIDDMHAPFHSPDPDKYDPGYEGIVDEDIPAVPFARAYNGEEYGYPERLKNRVAEFKSDPRNLEHLKAHYDASLNSVDELIGRFLEKMRAMGMEDNTVLIITGEHGQMLGEKGLINHTRGLYEPVLHVPLIVRNPAIPEAVGKRRKQLIQRIDLMPTILDIAGVDPYGLGLQGKSFIPLLKDPHTPWREYAFARNRRSLPASGKDPVIDERVARDGCWKLHHYLYKTAWELYDLCSDPLETRDLAKSRPDIVARLAFELVRNMEETRPHQPGPPLGMEKPSMNIVEEPDY